MRIISNQEIEITSAYNRSYREFLSLLSGRGVKKHGRAIVSGSKVVPEVIRQKPGIISGWIASPKHSFIPPDLPSRVPRYRLNTQLFQELDSNGTGLPLLIVDVPRFDLFDITHPFGGLSLFIPFQDPTNVGAVLRSAAAFNVSTVVLLKECANPYHQKSLRAAGTSLFNVNMMKGPSILHVENHKRPLIVLDAGGESVHDFTFPSDCILMPGLEGKGIPEDVVPDHVLSIPISKEVESLNAAVATSIALYEWQRQNRKRD